MSKRSVIVALITALVVGGIAYFQYVFKPQMIRGFIENAPRPVPTVVVEAARSESWLERSSSIGTLIASEGVEVAAQVGGTVQRIHFDSGQKVETGVKLVELDTDIEKADLASSRATLKEAELAWQRQVDLKRKAVTSDANVDAARARRDTAAAAVAKTEATIAKKTISAPFAGRLGIRKVEVGQYVSPGLTLVTLQALDPMWVDFPMPERLISSLFAGQGIEITVDAFPGQTFRGKILVLDARVAADTRTLMVRGEIPNADSRLLPGMFANVTVVGNKERPVVTVPRTAITYSLYGDSVWVLKQAQQKGKTEDSKSAPSFAVERRFVKSGETQGNRTSIVEGLKEGERVVTSGQIKLNPGATVRIAQSNPLTPPDVRPKE